jgi:hypothetical protein
MLQGRISCICTAAIMWRMWRGRIWDLAEGVVFRFYTMWWKRSWRLLRLWLALRRHYNRS